VLGRVVSDNQRDWDEHVSYGLGAYRATKHSATGSSPNYLVFGRELASPFELMFPGIPGIGDIHNQNHGEYVATLKDRFRRSYTLVRENLKAVAFRNKKRYDQRVKKNIYMPETGYGCSTLAGCKGNHPSGNVIMTVLP